MNAAVHEAVIANDNNSNIAVAVDGTWHKRGYSSLNGVVCATSVENGKVIDFEALTKYCSSCARGLQPTERALLIIDIKRLEAERIVNKVVHWKARNKEVFKRKMDKQNLDEENEIPIREILIKSIM
ncbi:hypothetical protein TNCV_3851261 [Trichonephila clavipes]|nr:hypothetical protein TNCV_3851261 [Trichonephila clavipes]